MPFGYTYTTIDGKIVGIPNISYIDALISNPEDGLKYYKVGFQNNSEVKIEHEDETQLKKDRRRLELKWDNYFSRKS